MLRSEIHRSEMKTGIKFKTGSYFYQFESLKLLVSFFSPRIPHSVRFYLIPRKGSVPTDRSKNRLVRLLNFIFLKAHIKISRQFLRK
jgi:hypothetical protein